MRKHIRNIVLLLLISIITTGLYYFLRSNPAGTDYQSRIYNIAPDDIDFLYDLTYMDANGDVISEQEIFDRIFFLIDRAERYILLDMFLFNSYVGKADNIHRDIASRLTERLINRKLVHPEIRIDFITDPINKIYGGVNSKELDSLTNAGVNVIYTDLHKLRDSNIIYSPIWRLFFQWFVNSKGGGILPNPFSYSDKKVTLRSYLEMLNFKANHRKIFLADHDNELKAVVTSANPHNGSSAHSNVAFEITGPFAMELFKAEKVIAEFSNARLAPLDFYGPVGKGDKASDKASVRLITENRIEEALLECIDQAKKGDGINIGVFYLSDRRIINSLLKAAGRKVDIRIILDPNKDAFGREKNGIPNRQKARELIIKSDNKIRIRWYDTHGEQYHSKFADFDYVNRPSVIILGSANFTRRNLDNYNLELDIKFTAPSNNRTIMEVREYFEKIWNSKKYTADYSKYEDDSSFKMFLAGFFETTGASTF